MNKGNIDVAIIGGGPAGLAAATTLKTAGVDRVVVFEREDQAGGIPRHCGHPPFGMREFYRVLTGPQYAKKLVERALEAGVEICTQTSVVEARAGGELLITSDQGMEEITARRVIYATGVRETPRPARMISGARPLGVLNTGALQGLVYLKKRRPFKRPVIIGSELVSFSALQTCAHLGIKPVAMIEENERVTARWPIGLYPKLKGVPLYLSTRLKTIKGNHQVEGVEVEDKDGQSRIIECDGVLLTGQFTPEASLARCGHLEVDVGSGGPTVDQYGRCSDPVYFASGNVLRPVETAGWCWQEGCDIGRCVAMDLAGELPEAKSTIQITCADPRIKFAMPQRLSFPLAGAGLGIKFLQLRFRESVRDSLVAVDGTGAEVWRQKLRTHQERRILVPLGQIGGADEGCELMLKSSSHINEKSR